MTSLILSHEAWILFLGLIFRAICFNSIAFLRDNTYLIWLLHIVEIYNFNKNTPKCFRNLLSWIN